MQKAFQDPKGEDATQRVHPQKYPQKCFPTAEQRVKIDSRPLEGEGASAKLHVSVESVIKCSSAKHDVT